MSEPAPNTTQSPNCHGCRHFFITYEPAWPYGCRQFAMKTRSHPSAEVLKSSGAPCQAFSPREVDSRDSPARDQR